MRTPCASGTRRRSSRRGTAAVVLPGGFSYGDYLRCGAIARFSPIMDAVSRFAGERRARARDLQRLPDPHRGRTAARARSARTSRSRSSAATSRSTVERTDSPFTSRCDAGQTLTIPVKHGDGCWFADPDTCASSRRAGQILLRYARGREPERRGRRRRGRLQRGGERLRPDAPPRARGRPAARLDRRGAASSARSSTLLDCRPRRSSRQLTSRPAERRRQAESGPSAARSRSRSRTRSVTGPRRTTPSVVYAKRTSGSPRPSRGAGRPLRSACRPSAAHPHLVDHRRAPRRRHLRRGLAGRRVPASLRPDSLRFAMQRCQPEGVTCLCQDCNVSSTGRGRANMRSTQFAVARRRDSGVDRDVPGHRRHPVEPGRGSPGSPRDRTRPRAPRACTRTARCPRASARRRRRTRARPPQVPLHRVERAVPGRRPLLDPVGERLRPARVRDPEAHDRDRRLVVVLLEEHPLQHLRPLVAILRARSAFPRRSTRGSPPTPPAAGRRRARASARAAPGSARRAPRAGSSGRRRRASAARTAARDSVRSSRTL